MFHKGFKPLDGAIPEEGKEGNGTEQAYDVIKCDPLSVGAQYDFPKSKPSQWDSAEPQFGVVNPCYATALEERQTNFYDIPKDSK